MAVSDRDKQARMLNDPLPGLIFRMAYPTMISFLITQIYNLVDAFFVSGLGINATAAIGVNGSLDQIIMMSGAMLAMGANSCIARSLGAGNREKAHRILSTAFFLAMAVGASVLTLGLAFLSPLVDALGATPTCRRYAMDYALYVLLAAPITASNQVMNHCLRSEGSALRSMLGSSMGCVLNCFLDPLFISVWDLGVAGASMATALSKACSFAVLFYPYLFRKSTLRISIRHFSLRRAGIGEILNIGSSSMLRTGLGVLSSIVLNRIAGGMSDAVLAGVTVANKVMMLPFSAILGYGAGVQPITGFNWGAKRFRRVLDTFRIASRIAAVGGAVMGVVFALFADPIILLFAKTSPEAREIGALCIRLQCLVMPIHAWVAVVDIFCAGLGYAQGARILATARQGTMFLPIIYPLVWLFRANGLAAVQAVADGLTVALALPILAKARRMIREAELAESGQTAARASPSVRDGIAT